MTTMLPKESYGVTDNKAVSFGSGLNKDILIVGGGPSGLLAAYALAKRVDPITGNPIYDKITVVEKDRDLRLVDPKEREGRGNYGLVLSHRAIESLKKVGLWDVFITRGVLYHRVQNCLNHDHLPAGMLSTTIQGKLSIERDDVVKVLLEALEKDFGERITIMYSLSLKELDFKAKTAYFVPSQHHRAATFELDQNVVKKLSFGILIGADGAHSQVVQNLIDKQHGINFTQNYAEEPFFSVQIPFEEFEAIGMVVDRATMYTVQSPKKNANLVILPSSGGLGIALIPSCKRNKQLPKAPENNCFHTIKSPSEFEAYLTTSFPKLGSLLFKYISPRLFPDGGPIRMPRLFYVTTEVSQYHHPNCPVIALGDAVHAMPPYVGQGINAAFEDIAILSELVEKHRDDWSVIPEEFTRIREPQGSAVQELNKKYIRGNFSFQFALRLTLDVTRNLLHNRLPRFVEPSVIQLLSQTSVPYKDILLVRDRQFRRGCTILLTTVSLSIFGAITLFKAWRKN